MASVHQRLGVALIALGLVGTVWALLGWHRRGGSDPGLRAYARLTLLALVLQALLGVALVIRGDRPGQGIHFFYGPSVLFAMLAGIVLGLGERPRREAFALFAGFLGVFLLGIRAVGTGG